ncbi:MAG: ABC transporter substrate-binding protein [Gammaproteobacteria bacterium]|nr:ABC transporter substrate-binding protein [Gammaproteobacteria bacterium]
MKYIARNILISSMSALLLTSGAAVAETEINIAGWGAKSGPLRSFGINSEAVMSAAVERVNQMGGVKLADGSMAKLTYNYSDSACNAEQAIAVARKEAADGKSLIGIGPTCSGAAAAMYGVFQKQVDDTSDTGLQYPILTDTAVRNGLAKISQWTFRNTPNEPEMYDRLWAWVAANHPDLKTIYGGTETDQGHSNGTYSKVIVQAATRHGFNWATGAIEGLTGDIASGYKEVLNNSSNWLQADTSFSVQARAFRRSKADIFIISSHPFTTCGMLKELARQRVEPKLIIGLTSSSSAEVMKGCAAEAEGMIIPTSFAPITEAAAEVAALANANGGDADLHSAAAWENVMIIKQVIENVGITGDPAMIQQERRKVRDGLEALTETNGLLGKITRVQDEGEALKPYVFVQAQGGSWNVIHDPR